MTNLEHYGFNNLIFEDYDIDGRKYIEIYYKTKHSKDNIKLLKRLTTDQKLAKVKWLLAEYIPWKELYPSSYITTRGTTHYNGINGGFVRCYKMKHYKKEY